MAYNLKDKLVVAVSSRALFDLEDENRVFEERGLDEYYKYQLEKENEPLKKGTGYRLIENLLKINEHFAEDEKQVEVIILSKNNAGTSLRITNAIENGVAAAKILPLNKDIHTSWRSSAHCV